jgi:hypothetical protein
LLAENDDISPQNLNSRIIFTPKQDGMYRIVATSFRREGRGQYSMTVREFKSVEVMELRPAVHLELTAGSASPQTEESLCKSALGQPNECQSQLVRTGHEKPT